MEIREIREIRQRIENKPVVDQLKTIAEIFSDKVVFTLEFQALRIRQ